MYLWFLNSRQSKWLAITLIAMGILLMPDFIAPTPLMDVILNVPLAMLIADLYAMEYLEAFMATYIISFALVLMGILIYPYNTKRLLMGRMRASAMYIARNPFMLVVAIIGVVIAYMIGQYAYDTIWVYAKETIRGVI